MEGKRKLTESHYLEELNATLDEISVELNLQLKHFKRIPDDDTDLSAFARDIEPAHLTYYLRAERIMKRHFALASN